MCKLKITLFPNGMNLALDENGEKVAELEGQSWLGSYIKKIATLGFDPTQIEFILPDESHVTVYECRGDSIFWGWDYSQVSESEEEK